MHPALHSWREELPAALVRAFAYVAGIAILSIIAAQLSQLTPTAVAVPPAPTQQPAWIEVERPFPAFTLTIPEAADVPAHYAIRRHAQGGGRKDILELGDPDCATPYLHVEIYRPGSETLRFANAEHEIAASAAALKPSRVRSGGEPLMSKFGPLSIVVFETSTGTPRQCLGFTRTYDDPLLQLSGWFCQGGAMIERSTLACALDRLSLLAAGSEPKVGALFAQAERNRSFCGQRDPILASTPKYKALWQALPTRPEPRRIGR